MRGECVDHGQAGNSGGYGTSKVSGRTVYMHRKAYADTHSLDVFGMVGAVMHKCDNPRCVNPAHLMLGTHSDNTQDMLSKRRSNPPSGSRSATAVLSDAQVETIRSRYVPRCKVNGARAMGREYGVSNTTIRDAIKHRTWKES